MDIQSVKIEGEEISRDDDESSTARLMEHLSAEYLDTDDGDDTRCLFCSSVTVGKRCPEDDPLLPGSHGNGLVNRQLWALFVLRHVLEYPREKITELMKWGISPADWFSLCHICEKTARHAMSIYVNLLKLTDNLKSVQNEARIKIRESFQEDERFIATVITSNDNVVDVCKRIRGYYKDYELSSCGTSHSLDNSFVETTLGTKENSPASLDTSSAFQNVKHNRQAKHGPKKKLNESNSKTTRKRKMNLARQSTILPQKMEQSDADNKVGDLRSGQEGVDEDRNSDEDWMQSNFDDFGQGLVEDGNGSDYERKPKIKKKSKKGSTAKARKEQLNLLCEICLSSRRFPTSNLLARHMRHHKISQHSCPKCKYPCLSEPVLERHLRRNKCSPQYDFKCDFCDFVTERRCNLTQHQTAIHPNEVVEKDIFFKCDICGLQLRKKDKQQYEYHLLVHKYFENNEEIDGKLKCKVCGELTIGNRDLRRHTREEHGAELGIPAFQCNICDKTFSREDSLENHVAVVHTKQCRFFCEQCGYGTMRKSCLEKHIQLHSTEKPFVCELCAAPFKCEKSFKMHMKRTHSASRKSLELKCKYCYDDDVVFINKSLLNRHMKQAHEDLYTHKCDQCENSYLSGASLQLHKKISHGGQQPVECQFCQTKVLSQVYLYGHYKSCRKKPPGFKSASKL